jgi:type IV secretion system protein VirD4
LTYVGSAVVIDPKGENAMITAARRGKGDSGRSINGLGQSVHVVDPWGITGLPVGG